VSDLVARHRPTSACWCRTRVARSTSTAAVLGLEVDPQPSGSRVSRRLAPRRRACDPSHPDAEPRSRHRPARARPAPRPPQSRCASRISTRCAFGSRVSGISAHPAAAPGARPCSAGTRMANALEFHRGEGLNGDSGGSSPAAGSTRVAPLVGRRRAMGNWGSRATVQLVAHDWRRAARQPIPDAAARPARCRRPCGSARSRIECGARRCRVGTWSNSPAAAPCALASVGAGRPAIQHRRRRSGVGRLGRPVRAAGEQGQAQEAGEVYAHRHGQGSPGPLRPPAPGRPGARRRRRRCARAVAGSSIRLAVQVGDEEGVVGEAPTVAILRR